MALGATAALFVYPKRRLAWSVGRALVAAWLAWALVSVFFSDTPAQAFYGTEGRVEGWLTWVLLARVAWQQWETTPLIGVLGIVSLVAGLFFPVLLTPIAAGALAATVAGLFANTPWLAAACLVPAGIAGSRAGILAGCLALLAVAAAKRQWRRILWASALVVCTLVLTPVGKKFLTLDPSTMGNGARSQLASWSIGKVMQSPWVGYGMDSAPMHLPSANVAQPKAAYDRSHFGPMDMALQVGLPGLALLLMASGWVAACAWKRPTDRNAACLGAVVAWWAFGCFNPQGIPAGLVFLTALAGAEERA